MYIIHAYKQFSYALMIVLYLCSLIRKLYHQLMEEILYNPHTMEDAGDMVDHVSQHYIIASIKLYAVTIQSLGSKSVFTMFCVQPLNPDPTSPWKRYFEDNDILHQIDNDTR